MNEAREERGLPPMTLGMAIDEIYDPYNEIERESMDAILQEYLARSVEYGD